MDASIATLPDYTDIYNPTGIELNNINVGGTITVDSGVVTAAVIMRLDPLSFGTFQTVTTTSNLVAVDTSLVNNDWLSGTGQPLKSVLSNPMTWTYNSGTGQLNHQAGGGTALTSSSIATCVLVAGSGPTPASWMASAASSRQGWSRTPFRARARSASVPCTRST